MCTSTSLHTTRMSSPVHTTRAHEVRRKHLQQLASACTEACPPLARFYLHLSAADQREEHEAAAMPGHMTCQSCRNLLLPGNHTVRLRPKRKMTSAVRQVMSKFRRKGQMASAAEVKLLQKFQRRKNHLVVQCTVCQGKAAIPAATRKHVAMATSDDQPSSAGTPVLSRRIAKAARRLKKAPLLSRPHALLPMPQTPSSSHLSSPLSLSGTPGASPASGPNTKGSGSSVKKRKLQRQRHAQLKNMLSQQPLGAADTSLSDFLQSL